MRLTMPSAASVSTGENQANHAGLAPVGFGRVYDIFGNYVPILTVVAVMSAVGGAMMLMLGRYPNLSELDA